MISLCQRKLLCIGHSRRYLEELWRSRKILGTQRRDKKKVDLLCDFFEGQSCMEAVSLAGEKPEKEMGLGNLLSPNVGLGLLVSEHFCIYLVA